MLFNCQKYTTAEARGEFEDAPWFTRFVNRVHFAVCKHCALFGRQMRLLGDALRWKARGSVDKSKLDDFEKRLAKALGGLSDHADPDLLVRRQQIHLSDLAQVHSHRIIHQILWDRGSGQLLLNYLEFILGGLVTEVEFGELRGIHSFWLNIFLDYVLLGSESVDVITVVVLPEILVVGWPL